MPSSHALNALPVVAILAPELFAGPGRFDHLRRYGWGHSRSQGDFYRRRTR